MKKKEELFYLINSLSKSEKRHFKIMVQSNGELEYLLLFNAIDSQEVYNEEKIRYKFRNKQFIKQLTSLKNYLKNKIFSSLRNYHTQLSIRAEVSDIIRNVEILFHKGLYKLCKGELTRAEKKANQFQINNLAIEILAWKRKIHQALFPQDWKSIEEITKEQNKLLQTSIEYTELILANVNPQKFAISYRTENNIHNLTLTKLHEYQLLLRQFKFIPAREKINELLDTWDSKIDLIKEYPSTYFSISNTYIAFLVHQKDYENAVNEISKLKGFRLKFKMNSAALEKEVLRMYNIELEIYRDTKDLKTGMDLIPEIEDYLEQTKAIVPINYLLSFQFQFATIYFLANDLSSSINWVNIILNSQEKYHRSDLITFTHWLNLLIHFEWGNTFVLRYFVDGMKRHLKKSKNLDPYEKALLKFLAKNVGILSKRELRPRYDQLLIDLQKVQIPQNILDYVDFINWIDKKRD